MPAQMKFYQCCTSIPLDLTLDTPVLVVDSTTARSLTTKLVRKQIPFKVVQVGSGVRLFVKVPAEKCAYLKALEEDEGLVPKLVAAASMARQCINHHGITGDLASAHLDEALDLAEKSGYPDPNKRGKS